MFRLRASGWLSEEGVARVRTIKAEFELIFDCLCSDDYCTYQYIPR